jgi:dipeptidyl aminopeptidase/acylaminoacyl peptidase
VLPIRRCLLLLVPAVACLLPWQSRPVGAEPPEAQPGKQPPRATRVYKDRVTPHWFADETKFWYRNDLKGGAKEFVVVDAETGTRGPAFDHAKLAASLSKATGKDYRADRLPFDDLTFLDGTKAVRFKVGTETWICDLTTYECRKGENQPEPPAAPQPAAEPVRDESLWPDGPAVNPSDENELVAFQQPKKDPTRQARSPDGKWTAVIKDNNLVLRDGDGKETPLTKDGKEGLAYGFLNWAPDSKALVAFRIEPGDEKQVHLIQSSPPGGGRAVLQSRPYALPGDRFTSYEVHLFEVAGGKELKVEVDRIDFGFPALRWAADGHTFSYRKTDRGHQRFRLIEVDSHTGKTRNLIDEKTDTFIWSAHLDVFNYPVVTWLLKTDEIVYVSEKSGARHLHLIDAKTGQEKNAITSGGFVVRGVDSIDEEKRQVWFRASGKNPGQDPYLIHYYRVNFDGSGLVALTEGDGNHTVQYSPTRKYLVDTYSRIDAAPVTELRRASDGKLVCKLEEADITELRADGWQAPEVFVAKGRDGTTDVWGIISRPRNFDPSKKYPVIEYVYAGPQGSFVPKSFSPFSRFTALTDLGFIVVQIDGMGTANRSKAFHDVCWKNLKDAGFPDRILWHKAVAAKYPYYDTTRVGIYGTSAGGQNAMGAVLFHGDFYKAAVAACGCHDNRMDKASWNEQWMGYPVGPQYAACSNVDNAYRLTGKLLLIVGEMDTNVPPESTMRVVDALIKANKDFDLLVVPGMGHSDGGAYGRRRLQDFFVRHLQGVEPPDRNAAPKAEPKRKDGIEPAGAVVQPDPIPVAPPPRLKLTPHDVAKLIAKPKSEAGPLVRRYDADRGALLRTYNVPLSPTRASRLKKFDADWLAAVKGVDPEPLSAAAREDLVALQARLEGDLKDIDRRAGELASISPLIPFAPTIIGLEESRRHLDPVNPAEVAGRVDAIRKQVETLRKTVEAAVKKGELVGGVPAKKPYAARAADTTDGLRLALRAWHSFYTGYDPEFTWWVAEPYKQADAALDEYAKMLRAAAKMLPDDEAAPPSSVSVVPLKGPSDVPDFAELLATPQSEFTPVLDAYRFGRPDRDAARWLAGLKKVPFDELTRPAQVDYLLFKTHLEREVKRQQLRQPGVPRPPVPRDDTGIVGRPIGREALIAELAGELIPYSPEELIAMARQELDWCDAEMLRASREMGFGDDWRKALEVVKNKHVRPGEQPRLIQDLAVEAINYLKANELVTVPPLAAETWRMAMMSPERQLVNPFFTGGEVITVSFPTNTMSHEAKLQSLRGNNVHFARATVHHELIPGHHLQQFMNARYHPQRSLFQTPFWTEGWALYWELVLYDKGFPKTPEDRIGFLTWRKHRCARIIFSLGYHLGDMTPRECIDLLVDRVGFEPENAAGEVRRSFVGGYGPLYQAAYLLGGFQFWALRAELVGTGKMTDRQFHDAILREHAMPVAMVRAIMTNQPLTADGLPPWRFRRT